jgi:hypothetical protein
MERGCESPQDSPGTQTEKHLAPRSNMRVIWRSESRARWPHRSITWPADGRSVRLKCGEVGALVAARTTPGGVIQITVDLGTESRVISGLDRADGRRTTAVRVTFSIRTGVSKFDPRFATAGARVISVPGPCAGRTASSTFRRLGTFRKRQTKTATQGLAFSAFGRSGTPHETSAHGEQRKSQSS